MNDGGQKPAPFVVPSTRMRDAIVAGVIALIVLGFVVYGVFQMSRPVSGNKLTGVVVEKVFVPLKEQLVDFSGRKLKGTRESEGEYVLKVKVDAENGRIYEVPVPKGMYEAKKKGDKLTFVKPPSEQK